MVRTNLDEIMLSSPPQLNLVVLRSSDIERAVSFYHQIGLLFMRHAHGAGPEHYTSEISGLIFELYPATSKYPSTAGTRIGFRVASVDDITGSFFWIGVEITTPPEDSEWGCRVVVKDFDGHVVEILTPK